MPHKEGHWGYKTRKKIQSSITSGAKKVGEAFNKGKNKSKLIINKYNPQSKSNKSIRKKESIIKSDTASRREKGVA